MDLEELRVFRNTHNPYIQRLGIVIEELRPGYSRVSKTVTDEDLNSLGLTHGGVYFSMADTACGSLLSVYGRRLVTVSASYQFLRSAAPGARLTAEARELRHGKLISAAHVSVTDGDGALLGSGEFTFCAVDG